MSRAVLALALFAGFASWCHSASTQNIESEQRFELNIPASSLKTALLKLALDTKNALIIPSIEDQETTELKGFYTLSEALSYLLKGTNLSGGLTERGVIVISRAAPPSAQNREGEMMLNKAKSKLLPGVAALALGTSPAIAQEPSNATVVEEPILEIVIVTARKREEKLTDVPIAISSYSNADLVDIGARDLADFIENSPGVSLNSDRVTQQISIRGVSTALGGNPNGYYLDHVPFTGVNIPLSPNISSFDLNRVEVLRGPQGTLFGEGSLGGTVRIFANSPELSEFGAAADVFASNIKDGESSSGFRGMVNIPIVEDKLGIRLVATDEDFGGSIDSISGEENIDDNKVRTYRGKILAKPTDRMTIEAAVWAYDQVADAGGSAFDDYTTDAVTGTKQEYLQHSLSLNYEFDFADFQYAYGNNVLEVDLSSSDPFFGDVIVLDEIDITTHEALLNGFSDNARWNWTFGLYSRTAERDSFISIANFGIDSNTITTSESWAVFGEVEYRINDQLRIATGLRYFNEDLSSSESGFGFTGPIDVNIDDSYDSVNPRVMVSYEPKETALYYVSAAKGFRGGQAQPTTSVQAAQLAMIELPDTVDSDSIWTYEVGTKQLLMDGRLQLEGALYFSDWDDQSVLQPLGPGLGSGLVNSSGTETLGLEIAATLRPTSHLTLQAGISLLDAEFVEDVPGTLIMEGDPPQEVSDLTWNASALYKRPTRRSFDVFARLGAVYTSERMNTASASSMPGDDVFLLDARLGLENDRYGVYLFADNITDEDGALSSRFNDIANRPRPQTLGIELRFTY